MENTLVRLLEAESRAEQLVEEAKAERKKIVDEALGKARAEEQRFEAGLPEIRADLLDKAEKRAEQTTGELKRRYDERTRQLRDLAKKNEQETVEAAMTLIAHIEPAPAEPVLFSPAGAA
ncbi:MAG: ATPase [Gammaproteobacteria bacterium]|nr:ATPase [Gammaproteobacteria bacterium]